MKASALVIEAVDGRFHAVAAGSRSELEPLAQRARDFGSVEIGGETVAVRRGAILSTWRGATEFRTAAREVETVIKGRRGRK